MPERRRCPSRRAVSKSGVNATKTTKPRHEAEANVKDFLRHFQKCLTVCIKNIGNSSNGYIPQVARLNEPVRVMSIF